MSSLKRAIEIATEAHKNQTDKAGHPYVLHLFRVMNMGKTTSEKIGGVLHDLVEDTPWTFEDLLNEGFAPEIVEALKCVTKSDHDESYEDFVRRASSNKLAIKIKLNDLSDNMDICRLDSIQDKDVERLNRYIKAYRYLSEQDLY